MRRHLVIAGPVWPIPEQSDEAAAGLAIPAFAWLAGRGERRRFAPRALHDWLGSRFGLTGWPAGPLTLFAECADEAGGYWLRADPVHLAVGLHGVELADFAARMITADEAGRLVDNLNRQFAGDGLRFVAVAPERWLLRLDVEPDAQFSSSGPARDIGKSLPQGADAMLWQRRLNEIQMVLHADPVNDQRMAHGLSAINSLWLWGGGWQPLRDALQKPADIVYANDSELIALAQLAGAAGAPRPAAWSGVRGEDALVLLDDLAEPARAGNALAWREAWQMLERDWFAPARQAFAAGRIDELLLTLPDAGMQITLRRHDRWKFWRRPWALW